MRTGKRATSVRLSEEARALMEDLSRRPSALAKHPSSSRLSGDLQRLRAFPGSTINGTLLPVKTPRTKAGPVTPKES